jgi:Tol biopolymer transport system component
MAVAVTVMAMPSASAVAPIAVARRGDLFVLDLPHDIRRLTDSARHERSPEWSPGGRRIAFVAGNHSLAWIDVGSGEHHRVLRVPERFEAIDAISWSPDGTRLAFSTHTLRGRGPRLCGQVWSVSADGGVPVKVLTEQAWVTGLAWEPDGDRLLASTEWPNGIWVCGDDVRTGLLGFRTDGSRLSVLASDPRPSSVDLSESGRRVVYRGWLRTCHACGEIWRSADDGSHAHVIAMPGPGMQGLYGPRFDPSGRRVAMVAVRREHASLWIMRADGSHRHLVLHRADSIDW